MRGEPRGRAVLPPLAAEAVAAVLSAPRLPATAAPQVALARAAAGVAIPVWLAMPAAAGRLRVARALHAAGGRPGPLVAAAGTRPPLDGLPPGATLYVDVGRLSPEAALALEVVLDDGAAWLVAGAEPDATVPEPLATRLGTVVLRVPRLRDRLADLPALTDATLAALAQRGRPAVEPTAGARARLAAHPWPGDVAELEAVLGRAWLLAGNAPIDAEHIVFTVPAAAPVPAPAAAPQPEANTRLEFLLAELAHEVRNPLVTVKTFAEHLPALLEDTELRARFAALTTEAIDRIDGLLDNVLAFARLGPPRPEPIEVGSLLDRLVAEAEPELAARAVHVRRTGGGEGRCAGDREHLSYALRNLLGGVFREVAPREEIVLDLSANGVVTMHFATGNEAAARLRHLAAPAGSHALTDPTLLPLAFTLARAALARSGGALDVVPEPAGGASLVVRLPAAEG